MDVGMGGQQSPLCMFRGESGDCDGRGLAGDGVPPSLFW